MSITDHPGNIGYAPVNSPEAMYDTIRELGIVPFFLSGIQGYSIEELTPKEIWFNDEDLGPWDWKIHAVQQGDIAYAKFLSGGKSAFATEEWYRELMNYRRSLPKYHPEGQALEVYDALCGAGSISSRELRLRFGVKKNQMDALLTKLQMATLVVTGDIQRVYRGPALEYKGWQLATYCRPDDLFDRNSVSAPSWARLFEEATSGNVMDHSPAESYDRLFSHIRSIAPSATDKQIARLLG